jgi:PAS domain S-box-containing protein
VRALPVLAVDDQPENLLALEAVLAPLGLELVRARSGEEALRLLLARDFVLVLLDVRMPGTDGLQVAELMLQRERTRAIPIVFLTAAADEVCDIARAYELGAVDYVVKPFDPELLRSKVAVFAKLGESRLALRRSEALLRGAFDAAPMGKTLLDAGGSIVRANRAFARMLDVPPAELAGAAIGDYVHPEDREAFDELLTGLAKPDPELRLGAAGGREVWTTPAAFALDAADGADVTLVQWVDVTQRRRGEEARVQLLFERAERAQAQTRAKRLEELQRLAEGVQEYDIEQLAPELARRLSELLDADAAEIELRPRGDASGGTLAGSHVRRQRDAAAGPPERWIALPFDPGTGVLGEVRVLPAGVPSSTGQELLHAAVERIALLIRGVQLHEQERRIAAELQRGLLPARPPELAGMQIATHFLAAGAGVEVGGDWYDAFPLPGGRLGVVIGDVTGRGSAVATAMAELRAVTRAFALEPVDPHSPAEVLERLHRYHRATSFEQLFTVLYLTLDPDRREVVWANAGHPPPLLRIGTGEVRILGGTDPMISHADSKHRDRRARLEAGDVLVLCTDGLIERRGETIDAGIERLGAALRNGPSEPKALIEHLLAATTVEPRSDDDITAVVVRLDPSAAEPADQDAGEDARRIHVTFSPDATVPGAARRVLERTFGSRLEPDELERAKLAVSELATNAVRHGEGDVTVMAELTEERLLVEVIDAGLGFEHIARERQPEGIGGWGLALVDAETSGWGLYDGNTHVWFEIKRRGAPPGEGR